VSIERERGGGFNLTCDLCGDSIGAESWDEAKAMKDLYGWRSRRWNGEWQDVCKDCLELERSLDRHKGRNGRRY